MLNRLAVPMGRRGRLRRPLHVESARELFRRPFQARETVEQAWAIARVSLVPTLLVAIPFTVLVSFTLNILLREIGAQVYGGTTLPGNLEGQKLDAVSAFEGVGQYNNGEIDDDRLNQIECSACPGAGSCGGMFTANTMASAIEALGMSLPGSASHLLSLQINLKIVVLQVRPFIACSNGAFILKIL